MKMEIFNECPPAEEKVLLLRLVPNSASFGGVKLTAVDSDGNHLGNILNITDKGELYLYHSLTTGVKRLIEVDPATRNIKICKSSV